MRLISCYNPKIIINKYTGKQVVARCGKCPACLNARSASWVQRLDNEMLQNRYTFFVTFQYDELHVPQLVLLRSEDRPNNFPAYIDSQTGVIVDLFDVPDVLQADIDYCENTKILLVHHSVDFQNFIKLLRKKIYEQYNERLRYYAAFEYGPTTFRPHIHSLFFFDSALLAKDFARLLSEYWKYGNTFDPHIVSGSASSYVASYVNSFASLPKIYLHPYIKQKALFSKRPPIGLASWTKETFKRLFDTSACELSLFRKSVSEFRYVPFWRSVSDRLYPKIIAFDRLSHYDRVLLYRLSERPIFQSRDYQAIKDYLSCPYWLPYLELFKHKLPFEHSKTYVFNVDSLKRFVSSILQVRQNALDFGVSIDYYVSKIEDYYDYLEKKELSDFYHLQDDYFKSHPLSDFLCLNPNFCLSVANKFPSQLERWQVFYLKLYAPSLLASEKPIFIKYNQSAAFQSLKGMHDKVYFINTKQKKGNDYLLANKDKFNNIITYNEEIKNYVKSKII